MLSARFIAARNSANEIRPEHLLLAVLDESPIENSSRSAAKALELPESIIGKLKQEIGETNSPKGIQHGDLPFSTSSRSLIDKAARLAQARQQHADGLYLLLAFLSDQSPLRDKLIGAGINREKVERALQGTN